MCADGTWLWSCCSRCRWKACVQALRASPRPSVLACMVSCRATAKCMASNLRCDTTPARGRRTCSPKVVFSGLQSLASEGCCFSSCWCLLVTVVSGHPWSAFNCTKTILDAALVLQVASLSVLNSCLSTCVPSASQMPPPSTAWCVSTAASASTMRLPTCWRSCCAVASM